MKIKSFPSISHLDAAQWDALVRRRYPFLRHAFLAAMERHACIGERFGWLPRHLGCFDGDTLVGALPLYEKHNSWGEFVFDHAWAEAFHRAGLAYYPKLVNAIPFTPARGQRVLVAADADHAAVTNALHRGARELTARGGFSGLHSLFLAAADWSALNRNGAVTRIDCQFHWRNHGYQDFDQFMATLKARKRKNIRHERERVATAGVHIQRLDGNTASAQDWQDFCAMYHAIYQRKYGRPAFTLAFFTAVAAAMPEQICLVLARRDGVAVAAALMYLDDHTLYGRHWGCRGYQDSLHFECCYYQGIELCIERGLRRFDPGAQGEHKIARGFLPIRTRSLHWMADAQHTAAIRQFADHERNHVRRYIRAAEAHSPYHAA